VTQASGHQPDYTANAQLMHGLGDLDEGKF